MRRIFIDLGAYSGDTIKLAKQKLPSFDEYIGFEPVPRLFEKACLRFKSDPTVIMFQAAASNKDGSTEFYISKNSEGKINKGSSVFGDKVNVTHHLKIECGTIDFSNYLKKNFFNGEYIYVKMDIEGSEYDVLEKMLDDGTINLVSKLCVEFHVYKIKSIPYSRHRELKNRLKETNVEIVDTLIPPTKQDYVP